jgi:hypothetical protein
MIPVPLAVDVDHQKTLRGSVRIVDRIHKNLKLATITTVRSVAMDHPHGHPDGRAVKTLKVLWLKLQKSRRKYVDMKTATIHKLSPKVRNRTNPMKQIKESNGIAGPERDARQLRRHPRRVMTAAVDRRAEVGGRAGPSAKLENVVALPMVAWLEV